jgi:2-polyprenyl-3-methyl-5-hydroxy-6-metoxy-1,4-benzoquinol methylase
MNPIASTAFAAAQATWNERFSKDGYVFGTEPNAWLAQNAGIWSRPARLLCVADGEGRNSVWLARQGHQVEAFDISEVGVRKAQALAADKGVQVAYSVASCDDFDWGENRYDGVAAIFVQFADPAMRRQMFARIAQCLKPGGVLLLQGYTPRQLELRTGGPGVLSHLYTRAQLEAELQGLSITRVEDYEAVLHEGSGHAGLSALLGLTAFKPR